MNKIEEKEEIPSDFRDVSICFCSFYKVRSPLECGNEFTDKIIKCVILITKVNSLIEIENSCVKRVQELNIKNISKIIVHHEYEPFCRYVVLLTNEMTVHVLDYETIEEINSWTNINDVCSEDLSETGRPKLLLKKMSGGCHTVTEGEFLVRQCPASQENSRTEAIVALNNKLKSIIWLAESIEAEVIRKEAFISRKISDLSSQLQTNRGKTIQLERGNEPPSILPEGSQVSSVATGFSITSRISDNNDILKVLNTRQRIVHNKWVICVAIVNISDRYVIRSPDLILHSEKSLKCLHYRTRILKTYQWTYAKGSLRAGQESDVTIEDLDPPVVRPKKKAFLIAVCDFPDFSFDDRVSCGGLITFHTRSTRPDSDEEDTIKQIPFPPVQLDAKNLKPICADVIREQGSAGFSFELFTLIAASKCHNMTVNSVASPLDQVIDSISKDSRIIKVQGLSGLYCFYIPECPPLHLASFTCKRTSANQLCLKTYTKDDKQGIILIHNLKDFLPFDAFISTQRSCHRSSTLENSCQRDLLAKMNLAIAKIKGAFEPTDIEKVPEKMSKTDGSKSRILSGSHNFEMEEEKYVKWRKDISDLSLEMEMLLQHM